MNVHQIDRRILLTHLHAVEEKFPCVSRRPVGTGQCPRTSLATMRLISSPRSRRACRCLVGWGRGRAFKIVWGVPWGSFCVVSFMVMMRSAFWPELKPL